MTNQPARPLPCDYDNDPERWVSRPVAAVAAGDVHEIVAVRFTKEGTDRVLDIGSGHGRLGDLLAASGCRWLGIDVSLRQLAQSRQPVIQGDAYSLPLRDASFDAVTALWMLYHLAEPLVAIREAYRVLRPGGLFVASSTRRDDSPEVEPTRDPTTFDTEEAPEIVGQVFDKVEVNSWDEPMFTLPDETAIRQYLASRMRDLSLAKRVEAPVTVTKRGSLVWGQKRSLRG